MNKKGCSVILLLAVCSWTLVEGFNFDRDVLSHFRSKRQATGPLKRVCAAELYTAPLKDLCKTPAFLAHSAPVGKCLGSLKMKSLADGEPVCIFDCVYKANKWISATGVLEMKKIGTDFAKGVDKTWAPIVAAGIKKCGALATKQAAVKLASGYVTKCKVPSYVMQTCLMTEVFGGCPAAARHANFNAGKTALLACDATAMFKTPADLAKAAMGGLKNIDTKMLQGKDPKALLAQLPPGMAGLIPKGMDIHSPQAKALLANPAALAGMKLPPGVNLAALMG